MPDTVLDALRVVKAPVLAVPVPNGGGVAKSDEKPPPLTLLETDSVLKAPVFGAIAPIGGGDVSRESIVASCRMLEVSTSAVLYYLR